MLTPLSSETSLYCEAVQCKIDGMTLAQRFEKARKARKLSQSELARLLGVTRNAVSMWEREESNPKSATLQKAAVILQVGFDWLATGRGGDAPAQTSGLPLIGEIAGGVWAEVDSHDAEVEYVPVAPDPRYPASAQYALKVRGNSVNKVARDGIVVICVDVMGAGIEIRENDLVWVERRQGHLVEATVKRIRKGKDGLELWPESDDPRHQEKVPVRPAKGDAEVEIKGLVIATYNPISRGE